MHGGVSLRDLDRQVGRAISGCDDGALIVAGEVGRPVVRCRWCAGVRESGAVGALGLRPARSRTADDERGGQDVGLLGQRRAVEVGDEQPGRHLAHLPHRLAHGGEWGLGVRGQWRCRRSRRRRHRPGTGGPRRAAPGGRRPRTGRCGRRPRRTRGPDAERPLDRLAAAVEREVALHHQRGSSGCPAAGEHVGEAGEPVLGAAELLRPGDHQRAAPAELEQVPGRAAPRRPGWWSPTDGNSGWWPRSSMSTTGRPRACRSAR